MNDNTAPDRVSYHECIRLFKQLPHSEVASIKQRFLESKQGNWVRDAYGKEAFDKLSTASAPDPTIELGKVASAAFTKEKSKIYLDKGDTFQEIVAELEQVRKDVAERLKDTYVLFHVDQDSYVCEAGGRQTALVLKPMSMACKGKSPIEVAGYMVADKLIFPLSNESVVALKGVVEKVKETPRFLRAEAPVVESEIVKVADALVEAYNNNWRVDVSGDLSKIISISCISSDVYSKEPAAVKTMKVGNLNWQLGRMQAEKRTNRQKDLSF